MSDVLYLLFGLGVGVFGGLSFLSIFDKCFRPCCRKTYVRVQFKDDAKFQREELERKRAQWWSCVETAEEEAAKKDAEHKQLLDDVSTDELEDQFVDCGVIEDLSIIVAIDATRSNKFKGRRTFGGKNLHTISDTLNDHKALKAHSSDLNPYERCILAADYFLKTDKDFPLYYFGSEQSADVGGFLHVRDCEDTEDLWMTYRETIVHQKLSGPGRFLPLLERAMERVKQLNRYHILLILTDGDIEDEEEFGELLSKASSESPLSIVVVGIGDGPFDTAAKFDDYMPEGKHFDNLQFVSFQEVHAKVSLEAQKKEFFVQAFNEIPRQYRACKEQLKYRAPLRRNGIFLEDISLNHSRKERVLREAEIDMVSMSENEEKAYSRQALLRRPYGS